jgi:acetylornithine deacetylase/succinyl-diaminopimelate desuccinylase-like protein
MKRGWSAAFAALLALPANAQDLRPDQRAFRALYQELVETNTTLSSGSCTLAAQRMAAHLKAAGYPDSDLHFFSVPDHPKEGGLVAVLPGSDPKAKAILLLAHLDVVEAKREDWTRDPFKLVEEGGYFYGRGTADDKSLAAAWVDTMVRFKHDHVAHRRPLKLALTCGEETNGAFNGAEYLSKNQRALIDAEFGLTEGGWGTMDEKGKRIALNINAGEKLSQNYTLEVTNPGGHSMRPVKDNAIYHLSAGLLKIGAYDFPVQTLPVTREYFAKLAPLTGGAMGAAMTAFAKNPADTKAIATLAKDPRYNATLRTTCVATLVNAGHATNALPQRATANVNCRIYPGTTTEQVRDRLQQLVADPQVKVTAQRARNEPTKAPPPLTPALMQPIIAEAAKRWPSVPVIPQLEIGATDASFLTPAGIPTYGFTAMFFEPDGSRLHGLNERIRAQVLYEGRDFLYDLVKIYSSQK